MTEKSFTTFLRAMNLVVPCIDAFPNASLIATDDTNAATKEGDTLEIFTRKSPKLSFYLLMHGERSADVERIREFCSNTGIPKSWRGLKENSKEVSDEPFQDSKPSGDSQSDDSDDGSISGGIGSDCDVAMAINMGCILDSIAQTARCEDLRQFCSDCVTSREKLKVLSGPISGSSSSKKQIGKQGNPIRSTAMSDGEKKGHAVVTGGSSSGVGVVNKDFTLLLPNELLALI
jgi:hypothetical protein